MDPDDEGDERKAVVIDSVPVYRRGHSSPQLSSRDPLRLRPASRETMLLGSTKQPDRSAFHFTQRRVRKLHRLPKRAESRDPQKSRIVWFQKADEKKTY